MTEDRLEDFRHYANVLTKLRHPLDERVVYTPSDKLFTMAGQSPDYQAAILDRSNKKMKSLTSRLVDLWDATSSAAAANFIHVKTSISNGGRLKFSDAPAHLRYEHKIREEFSAMAHAFRDITGVQNAEIFVSGEPKIQTVKAGITYMECSWFEEGQSWTHDGSEIIVPKEDWLLVKPGFEYDQRPRTHAPRVVVNIIPDFQAEGIVP
jgi:hypothetical protein